MMPTTSEPLQFQSIRRKLLAFGLKIDVKGLHPQNVDGFSRLAATGSSFVFVDSSFTGPVTFETVGRPGLSKFILPSDGLMEVVNDDGRYICAAGSAFLFDLSKPTVWTMHGNYKSLCVFMDTTALQIRLSERLGQPIARLPVFAPLLELTRPEVAAFAGFVKSLQSTGVLSTLRQAPESAKRLSMLLADMILEVLDHDQAHLVQGQARDIPRRIRRAMAYIEAHSGRLVPNSELSKAVGVGIRTLQYEFRQYVGRSITDYARCIRLANARRDLVNDKNAKTEEIARRWGFTNTARFKARFLKVYGESVGSFISSAGEK